VSEKENQAETNVLHPAFNTKGDIPVENVRACAEKTCEKLLCIGIDKDGRAFYSASFADGEKMLWMIEQFKAKLLSGKFV
jgi:hypothetical protein